MVKKYILGIVTVIILICITAFIYMSVVFAKYENKENLVNTIESNNIKISQIENAQNKLHEAAEAMRQLQTDDTIFINSLSSKWLELNETKNILIQDNINCQQKLNEIVKEENSKKYMGEFTLVAYYQGNITSTGTRPKVNHTIAVDPKVIPYGSKVYIEGYGTYIAEDCGGGIKGNMIDIYMSSYNECIQFGRRKAKVYIIN